jgi:hypothetical protein
MHRSNFFTLKGHCKPYGNFQSQTLNYHLVLNLTPKVFDDFKLKIASKHPFLTPKVLGVFFIKRASKQPLFKAR